MHDNTSKTEDSATAAVLGAADDSRGEISGEETDYQRECTKAVNILRAFVLAMLLVTAVLVSVGVGVYASNGETQKFHNEFRTNANRIVDSFHDSVERRLGAINTMATSMTSYAMDTKQTFPFVTMPNFVLRGSDLRIQASAMIVHWMPLVTDENRLEWEEYALANRGQITDSYKQEEKLRRMQDEEFGLMAPDTSSEKDNGVRLLQQDQPEEQPPPNFSILDDGSGYHERIWSNGATSPLGDEIMGSGPYLPLWQRSPVSTANQGQLNMNFGATHAFQGILPALQKTKQAVINRALRPLPNTRPFFESNLAGGQFRHKISEYIDDLTTFIAYPVFTSFDEDDRQLAGVLATNIYWKLLFTDIISSDTNTPGMICVLENSFNQTMAFRIDGPEATYLGEGDPHDPRYDYLEKFADVNAYVESRAGPETRSYTTVPLNREFGRYTLRVYPSQDTEEAFSTNRPIVYAFVVASAFLFTSLVFVLFAYVVERRQLVLMDRVVKTAEKAASTERELNEFLAHEVRNPLAAALSAHSFVTSAINETCHISDEDFRRSIQEDGKIITSSLHFIDEFLRSCLDMYRAQLRKLKVTLVPTDLLKDVLEPVYSMLYRSGGGVDITLDCPEDLIVATDSLRLKQICMNLCRNAVKFVDPPGFIRLGASVIDGFVELYVADSGPGIPVEKRDRLFEKFQTSMDVLSQGTGVGLSLCKNLVDLMEGDIWLDENYDSGVHGSPGARFVVQLHAPPLPMEGVFSTNSASDGGSTELRVPGGELSSTGLLELPENLSVLFVDDDIILRKLFSRSVRKVAPSWTIAEAASGEAALTLLGIERFQLIFMDQYMASTEKQLLGTEAVRALRSKGVTSTICGLSANDLEQEFICNGADSFLLKPIPCNSRELKRELLRILRSGQNSTRELLSEP